MLGGLVARRNNSCGCAHQIGTVGSQGHIGMQRDVMTCDAHRALLQALQGTCSTLFPLPRSPTGP